MTVREAAAKEPASVLYFQTRVNEGAREGSFNYPDTSSLPLTEFKDPGLGMLFSLVTSAQASPEQLGGKQCPLYAR